MSYLGEQNISTAGIIPAFNEERTVGNVVSAAMKAELIDSVFVVNDGSDDRTSVFARQSAIECGAPKPFAIIEHTHNKGKAEALKTGVEQAKALGGVSLQAVLFMDADASPLWSRETKDNQKIGAQLMKSLGVVKPHELTPDEETARQQRFVNSLAGRMDSMLEPVISEEQVMTIALFHRNLFADKLRLGLGWGALSGNRALTLSLWDSMIQEFEERNIKINGWGVEAALNTYTRLRKTPDGIKLNRMIGKQLLPDTVNVGSRKKARGTLKGLSRMATIHSSAMFGFAKFGAKL